jgi:hypothetical protein
MPIWGQFTINHRALLKMSIVILAVSLFSSLIVSGLIMTITTPPSLSWGPVLATNGSDGTPPDEPTTEPTPPTTEPTPPTTEPTPPTNATNATLIFGGYKIKTGWKDINFEKGCWTLEAIDGIFVYKVREGLDRCRVTSVYPDGTRETFQSFGLSDLVMVQGNTGHVEEGMSRSDEHVEEG